MRQWMVSPKILCQKHLGGEHVECHMAAGCLAKKKSVKGYLDKGLLEPQNLKARHDQLASEMLRRGYRHKSPLKQTKNPPKGLVDKKQSLKELVSRCPECRARKEACK